MALLYRLPEEPETRYLVVKSGWARIRTLSGGNFVTLDQHFQGQLALSMQNFCHFWSNVQGFALAGLAPKLKTNSFNPQEAVEEK